MSIPLALWAMVAVVVGATWCATANADEPGKPVDVSFTSRVDKTEQKYVIMLPAEFDADERRDLLIVLHGHGADRWQYVREKRGECKGARDVAARHGLIYVSPDYRATTSWMGPKAEADVQQLIGLLRRRYKVGKALLGGASMGGTSALIFAARHPKLIDGVVSQNGTANMFEFEDFQEAIAASYGGTKEARPDEYRQRSPELAPKRFVMPVAFCVGGKDTSVPPDSVRRLYARLKKLGKKDVLMIDREDVGHTTSYADTVKACEFVIKAARAGKRAGKDQPADGEAGEAEGPETSTGHGPAADSTDE